RSPPSVRGRAVRGAGHPGHPVRRRPHPDRGQPRPRAGCGSRTGPPGRIPPRGDRHARRPGVRLGDRCRHGDRHRDPGRGPAPAGVPRALCHHVDAEEGEPVNPASATAQVWRLLSALVGAVTVAVLVAAGLRRCWWSLRSDHHPLWRAAGVAWGVALLALAAMAAGFLLAATPVPGARWIAMLAAVAAIVLWAASILTGRAPDGQAWPGRPTARPHRPVWMVGVWLLAAS